MISLSFFSFAQGGFVGRDLVLFSELGYSVQDFVQLKQIHSDRIHLLTNRNDLSKIKGAEGDAIVTTLENVPISVRVADCVPILIAHPSGAVAAVHAGWRGTTSQILKKTLLEIKENLKLSLKEVKMVIGPAICEKCYEVGREVANEFSSPSVEGETTIKQISPDKFLLNLKRINQLQAMECGVPFDQIEIRPECTLCDEKDFYSYRGELKQAGKGEGRNYAWIVIENNRKRS